MTDHTKPETEIPASAVSYEPQWKELRAFNQALSASGPVFLFLGWGGAYVWELAFLFIPFFLILGFIAWMRILFRCPRCLERFFLKFKNLDLYFNFIASECVHCHLAKYAKTDPVADAAFFQAHPVEPPRSWWPRVRWLTAFSVVAAIAVAKVQTMFGPLLLHLSEVLVFVAAIILGLGYAFGLITEWRGSRLRVPKYKRPRAFAVQLLAATVGPTVLGFGAFALDAWGDWQHSVSVTENTPMYRSAFRKEQVFAASPGEEIEILRILETRNGKMIRIRLNNGKKGWIEYGKGVQLR